MRIGLSCNTIEPAITKGKIDGIGVYTQVLLDQLIKLKHHVKPLSFPSLKNWIKTSSYTDGKIFSLPYQAATIASFLTPSTRLFYPNLDKNIDILHITDHKIPRIKGVPIVATIHDALMYTNPEWYPSKIRAPKNWLRKKTFSWADHFITISYAMIPELVKYMGIPEKKITVVHNGIAPYWNEEISLENRKAILKKLQLPEKFILYTGTLQPKKNVSRIIDAFLDLPSDIKDEYPLVITGKAGWGADNILSSIQTLTSQKAGYWLDYVSLEELRALYQSATIYVCPSLHEGFGYTVLEAFASKTPVLTSNISALPEVASNAAYFVDPYSVNDIKHGLQNLLTSELLRTDLIEKGRVRAKDFSQEKCARETLAVYEKV